MPYPKEFFHGIYFFMLQSQQHYLTATCVEKRSVQPSDQAPWDNLTWVASLRGQRGSEQQHRAYRALAKYLYRVAYNYLFMRQNNLRVLATFAAEELAALAEEFVQDFMLKLSAHDHALLAQYQGEAHFTSFAALILRRMIAKELQKKSWTQRDPWPEQADDPAFAGETLTLEEITEQLHQSTALTKCWQTLAAREQTILLHSLLYGDKPQAIAEVLGISANAVSIALLRAKNKLRACLATEDLTDSGL
jgi:RNA polymerase sigma factor (sigma-70 family)